MTGSRPTHSSRLVRGGVEVGVVGVVFGLYNLLRVATRDAEAVAFRHGWAVLEWQESLSLPDELAVQRAMLASEQLTRAANLYYAGMHFPVTVACLIWLYARRRSHYAQVRNLLVVMTAAGMVLHAAYPLAPPRMLDAAGFVDTAALLGPSVYGGAGDSVSNQFAAMPSLHFGWAVVVAYAVLHASVSPARWLAVLHPVCTLLVIVGTGNHYWIDAGVAAGLFGLALLLLRRPFRRPFRRRFLVRSSTGSLPPQAAAAPPGPPGPPGRPGRPGPAAKVARAQ